METKKLQQDDIRNALDLIWKVFEEFEAPVYSEEGIDEFKKFILYDSIIEKMNQGVLDLWGCADNGRLAGVIAAREFHHICLLFVDKEYHRRGIARSLFQIIEEGCKNQNHFNRITVNSSPYAKEAYHHLGFMDTDIERTVNGIRFIPMVYILNNR